MGEVVKNITNSHTINSRELFGLENKIQIFEKIESGFFPLLFSLIYSCGLPDQNYRNLMPKDSRDALAFKQYLCLDFKVLYDVDLY